MRIRDTIDAIVRERLRAVRPPSPGTLMDYDKESNTCSVSLFDPMIGSRRILANVPFKVYHWGTGFCYIPSHGDAVEVAFRGGSINEPYIVEWFPSEFGVRAEKGIDSVDTNM